MVPLMMVAVFQARTADVDGTRLYSAVREKVLENSRRMTRYMCVETVDRSQFLAVGRDEGCGVTAKRGQLAQRDRVRLDVTVVNGGEIFSWAGARRFEFRDAQKLVGNGATVTGEFGGFLLGAFSHQPDILRFDGMRDGLAWFNYRVPLASSTYHLHGDQQPTVRMGVHGSFAADPTSEELRQFVLEPDGFDEVNPVCRLVHKIDYGQLKVPDGELMIPSAASMDAWYRNGEEALNETHYAGCRQFVGKSTIRFGEDTAVPDDRTVRELPPLPPGLRVAIRLNEPIDSAIAAAGDIVTGVLTRDIRDTKRVVLAKAGELVHGRVLRMQYYAAGRPAWMIAIRFDRLQRGDTELPLTLKAMDEGVRQTAGSSGLQKDAGAIADHPEGGGLYVFRGPGNVVLGKKFEMEWQSE
jgi:hypothetical protein